MGVWCLGRGRSEKERCPGQGEGERRASQRRRSQMTSRGEEGRRTTTNQNNKRQTPQPALAKQRRGAGVATPDARAGTPGGDEQMRPGAPGGGRGGG
jgi:hypothetical protein